VRPLVQHADNLLRQCYAILGKAPTEALVRATFFSHFCAGEDSVSIKPRVASLRKAGVGGILDYAAEADSAPSTAQAYAGGDIQCRVYDYQSERQCDAHVNTFLDCIRAVKDVSPEGFAAIKVRTDCMRVYTCIAAQRARWPPHRRLVVSFT
jgi:proline dehydrogenase